MIETTHIAEANCPDLNKYNFDTDFTSLYKVLTEKYGILPSKTRYSVSMIYADSFSADLLNISKGTPLLGYDIISSMENDQIIEYCQTLKRCDLFGINSDLYPAEY